MTDRLGRLLLVTLEASRVNADVPVLETLRSWLDSWRGRFLKNERAWIGGTGSSDYPAHSVRQ